MNHENLTKLEIAALIGWSTNYNNAKDEKDDNATYHGVEEIAETCKITVNAAKGVATSLIKKGLASFLDDTGAGCTCYYLTNNGIDAHYQLTTKVEA